MKSSYWSVTNQELHNWGGHTRAFLPKQNVSLGETTDNKDNGGRKGSQYDIVVQL